MQRDLVKVNLAAREPATGTPATGKLVAGKFVTGHGVPFLSRFLGKFVLDIVPAALASVIGGFLFTQYHFGHAPQRPALEQVTPASAEMMALVRDEHAMIVDYVRNQMAAEKSRVAAEDADLARAQEESKLADAKTTAASPTVALLDTKTSLDAKPSDARPSDVKPTTGALPRHNASAAVAKPIVWRAKPPVVMAAAVSAPHAPIVIAQPNPGQDAPRDVPSGDRLASDPDSLLAKTLDLKDHVVAGARHAVSAIGDMFAAVGGALTPSASLPRQLSSD
jgi:hypothetical protein